MDSAGSVLANTYQLNPIVSGGLSDSEIGSKIHFFPNPVTNILTVKSEFDFEGEIKILDQNAQIIKVIKTTQRRIEIDLQNLLPGIYFLEYPMGERKLMREKFVKN